MKLKTPKAARSKSSLISPNLKKTLSSHKLTLHKPSGDLLSDELDQLFSIEWNGRIGKPTNIILWEDMERLNRNWKRYDDILKIIIWNLTYDGKKGKIRYRKGYKEIIREIEKL
jgi:hypothetical protein